MDELIFRFSDWRYALSAFALVGDAVRPKSFAGLFGAATVDCARYYRMTVGNGGQGLRSAIEARSMIAGAIAFFIYALS